MAEPHWLLLEKLHGHFAMFAVALCWHPVAALRGARRPSRWTTLTGALATGLLTLSTALGWWIYPTYRHELKRDLYLASPFWGAAFEVKEHWAHYAWCCAIVGLVALWYARRRHDPTGRQIAWWSYLLAGLLGAGVGVLGIAIASINGFEDLIPPRG